MTSKLLREVFCVSVEREKCFTSFTRERSDLRRRRRNGEEKDKQKADLQAMEGWAACYYQKPQAVNATKGYLRMLSKFSDSAHPLLPSKTMADVLSQK